MTDIRVQLSGTAENLLPELRSWLAHEDDLRGRVSAEEPTIQPGQMGGIAEVLIVALGAQGTGAALAASLKAWIRHRRPAVDIELTGADGRRVKIATRDASIDDVEGLIREVAGD